MSTDNYVPSGYPNPPKVTIAEKIKKILAVDNDVKRNRRSLIALRYIMKHNKDYRATIEKIDKRIKIEKRYKNTDIWIFETYIWFKPLSDYLPLSRELDYTKARVIHDK